MKILRHIFPVVAAIILFSSCSSGKEKVISRRDMAEIYAEMLLTDQWIATRPELRRNADTSLVYEPILNKYGYTTLDYVHTMDKYMDDPERYSRILRTTGEILDGRLKELEIRKAELDRLEEIRKHLDKVRAEVSRYITYKTHYPDTARHEYDHIPDSVTVWVDSNHIYCMELIFRHDSLIDGPRLVAVDTVQVADTVVQADTLKKN